jgi:hypothetical protein
MTDEYGRTDPIEEPDPDPQPEQAMPVEEHDASRVMAGAGDFTSGEGLVAFGGLLIVAVWLIFSVLITEYFISFLMLLLAVGAALLPRINRSTVESVSRLPVLMKVIGYSLALLGLFTLVEDVRFEAYDEIGAVLGALFTYAACVMAFIGARQIKI